MKKVADFEKSPSQWKYLGDKPAIIDFYADWCGPCRRLAPLLDELALEYENKIYIYKVNVDNEKEIAETFGITSLPTIVFVPLAILAHHSGRMDNITAFTLSPPTRAAAASTCAMLSA